MRPSPWTCLLSTCLLLIAAPVFAAWPNDPNVNVPVCVAANTQESIVSCSDGAGGMIIVWSDYRAGVTSDLYAQRISAAGVPLWAANGVLVCGATNNQYAPAIVADGSGGAYLTWTDARTGTADIYAQRLNASGVSQWTANGVLVCNATGAQFTSKVTTDATNALLVTWYDLRGGTGDIYAQKVSNAGVPAWTANGVAVCTAAADQINPEIVSDGSGGAVIGWQDFRNGNGDLYAQRLGLTGFPQWTSNGIAVCTAVNDQASLTMLPDGQGGALLAWADYRTGNDYDLYASRISPSGTLPWATAGVPVSTGAGDQLTQRMCSDGAGGCYIAWLDGRSGTSYDVYAQRLTGGGAPYWAANGLGVATSSEQEYFTSCATDANGGLLLAWYTFRGGISHDVYGQRLSPSGVSQWTTGGTVISLASGNQLTPVVVSDDAGGGLFVWQDARNALSGPDVYCQRVERYGQLGNAEPTITSVSDVKNDQGGFVKVVWSASYLDADPTYGITEYRVFRSVPGAALTSALAAGRATTTDSDEAVREGKLLVVPNGATATSWEYVGSQAAEAFATYSKVVATTADSVGGSNPRTWFLVEARASTSVSSDRWSSAPDSGYSVDNLPPAAPAPLTGQYLAGTTQLHWNRNLEADLAGYRLYRGSSAAFVPGPANFVAQLPDTGAADAAGAPYVYKLTAVDAHGNESPVATLVPSGTLGVDEAPRALAFAAPSPNPSRGSATLRFALTRAGHARLKVYDAAGRCVATPVDGALEAGEHAVAFALRDGAGRELPAGLYLARLEAEGRTLTRRIVATK